MKNETMSEQGRHPVDPAPGRRLRILAVGFLPPPVGGVSVSFKNFCDILAGHASVQLSIVNLAGRRRPFLLGPLRLLAELAAAVRDCDLVSLYCATPQVPTLGLATCLLSRWCGKRFILRKAAGMDQYLLGPVGGRLADFVVRHADLYLAQTKQLVERCRQRGIAHVAWYPTSRPLAPPREPGSGCRRFVYVGHVRRSKGIEELIEAAAGLPESARVDVYGPFYDHFDETLFAGKRQIHYRGILEPEQVQAVMRDYDAFVLPSKAATEGYPGAILEALSVGLPVITTNVGGIPEIVDARCGILLSPGDAAALHDALQRFIQDDAFYQDACRGALEARERFSTQYWVDWFVSRCLTLCDHPEPRGRAAEPCTDVSGKRA